MKAPEVLLKLLDEYELDIFTAQTFGTVSGEALDEWIPQLRTLIKNGLLDIIEKGKYCRHTFRNEYVIGNYLIEDGVIAYWSALHLHGLTEQFPNRIFVQSTRLKHDKKVFGVSYKFVKILPRKMTGITTGGYGNNRYRITDIEKTIADCFDLPQYSGGYPELIRALAGAEIHISKLWNYLHVIGNLSAIKRIAWISQVLELKGFTQFRENAKDVLNEKYSLLDPFGPEKGRYLSEWKLRLNLSESDIRDIAEPVY